MSEKTNKAGGFSPEDRIIVALDVDSAEEAYALVRRLFPVITWFKIGLKLFLSCGPSIVSNLKEMGVRVFLDLKFHDIPNTVAAAAEVAAACGADMFNIHLSGGKEMIRRTVEAAEKAARGSGVSTPLIIGVTVLTSFNEKMLHEEAGVQRSLQEHVIHLAALAADNGLHGVVASAAETAAIRERISKDMIIVTPGIRPSWSDAGDQQRIQTPRLALENGADYLVIGRPIIAHPSPLEAAERIIDEIKN